MMTPEFHGFVQYIKQNKLHVHTVRVLQGENLRWSWDETKDMRRVQHSISKSFTCMAVGIAIAEGKLSLDTKLREVFPQHMQESSVEPALQPGEITLRNLLRMSSGHQNPPLWAEERASLTERDWVKYYMSLPLDWAPGSQFMYSSGDTFMISAMVQAAVGETVRDYLVPRLFEPLGIHDACWETSPLGVTLGCAGLSISTEELSRFGQMLLQRGMWQGQQLVPAAWIDLVTRKQIANGGPADWGQGYGYQFWMCSHGAYRADGAHGQFCIVLPEREAVIAINSKEDNMQGILDGVWAEILPAL
ncbi:serine hydrolase domain-containing protein [Paenibacillus guangzhouensis]|uniref:serine hydrolase domain-containing protein n=1 Tax=Paenibacillus guangzhouensis TaxID=1473112 RepID=UPI001D10C347|nr:serine hydrolase [Paenibacillus guangzhouensis]